MKANKKISDELFELNVKRSGAANGRMTHIYNFFYFHFHGTRRSHRPTMKMQKSSEIKIYRCYFNKTIRILVVWPPATWSTPVGISLWLWLICFYWCSLYPSALTATFIVQNNIIRSTDELGSEFADREEKIWHRQRRRVRIRNVNSQHTWGISPHTTKERNGMWRERVVQLSIFWSVAFTGGGMTCVLWEFLLLYRFVIATFVVFCIDGIGSSGLSLWMCSWVSWDFLAVYICIFYMLAEQILKDAGTGNLDSDLHNLMINSDLVHFPTRFSGVLRILLFFFTRTHLFYQKF